MKAYIQEVNSDKTKAKVRFSDLKDENGNDTVSGWIDLSYLVFNSVMQLIIPFVKDDIVEVITNEYNERYITHQFKSIKKPFLSTSPDEVGMMFAGGNCFKYNTTTQELNVISSGIVNIKGSVINLN